MCEGLKRRGRGFRELDTFEKMAGKAGEREDWSDEEPPLLDEDETPAQTACISNNQHDDGATEPSIMDEMVAVATQAKAAKRLQLEKERRTTDFGAGLKKGFFNQSKATKPKRHTATASARPERLEVRDAAASKKKEAALRIVDSSTTNQTSGDANGPSEASPFVFPEVQDALKSVNQLDPNEWMNEQFFAKMAKNPKLLQALQNPRFTQAMNELQQNPQAAVLKYQRDPDVSVMLSDFMEFLGNHFEELGKQHEARDTKPSQSTSATAATQPTPPPPPAAIVDLDETRRQAIANMQRSPEEEEQVQKILRNPELLAALSDAKLMDRLHECQQDPRAFQRLAHDPVLGPKLRLLVDAKMVTFA